VVGAPARGWAGTQALNREKCQPTGKRRFMGKVKSPIIARRQRQLSRGCRAWLPKESHEQELDNCDKPVHDASQTFAVGWLDCYYQNRPDKRLPTILGRLVRSRAEDVCSKLITSHQRKTPQGAYMLVLNNKMYQRRTELQTGKRSSRLLNWNPNPFRLCPRNP
jgi:hypothetical protein